MFTIPQKRIKGWGALLHPDKYQNFFKKALVFSM